MPEIRIKNAEGIIERVSITDKELEAVLAVVKNAKLNGNYFIDLETVKFKKKDFVKYDEQDYTAYEGYDIYNPKHLEVLQEFQDFLDNLKKVSVLDKALEYYGKPFGKEGMVQNPIIDYVHWSEVAWALEEKLIGKYAGGNWFVGIDSDVSKQRATAKKFDAYMAKKKGLEKIKDREYSKIRNDRLRTNQEDEVLSKTNQ